MSTEESVMTKLLSLGGCMPQDCMVGLLFAFMPVLANKPSEGMDNFEVARLVLR